MQREIFVHVGATEVGVAIVENHELVEYLVERGDSKHIVGDVYKGVVKAVLPGIQAAFVDIGYEKAGFLHVSDLAWGDDGPGSERLRDLEADDERGSRGGGSRRREPSSYPPIESKVKKGDEVVVQVTKEPIGTKGPRLTAQLSLPGKFCVLMPGMDYIGVSRKILDRNERTRLKRIVQRCRPKGHAVIVRTAGERVEEEQLEEDIRSLHQRYQELVERGRGRKAPARLREEVGLVIGLVRDVFNEEVKRLLIDHEGEHAQLVEYVRTFAPELENRVLYYREELPIFDAFGIRTELEKSLQRQVWLKRGGYLVFDHSEALVAIDINTGKYVGKRNQAETILQTNLMAAREIPRQLRLRDIGGIIVIDFIDMESDEDKKKVVAELKRAVRQDRARTKVFDISPLGLVEMSRKRVRPALLHIFSEDCPYCEGRGHIMSVDSLTNKLETTIRRIATRCRERKYQIRVNPVLAHFIRQSRLDVFSEIQEGHKVELHLLDDPRLHREQHEITALETGRDLVAAVSR
ncbi:MAG: Rne/Rng family ribonuclease [Candidatus Krumholzibacteriia bacterium]|nr:Rne/Rng family ribonuclease [bacterium]MCB9513223.1 Rne/Rng family ribonuclease [Candidatus Latescibacterota bacterium]MCB9514687.1 Rne/Rng family ribonuclease [Candidatus Latescibacterota bacterium]